MSELNKYQSIVEFKNNIYKQQSFRNEIKKIYISLEFAKFILAKDLMDNFIQGYFDKDENVTIMGFDCEIQKDLKYNFIIGV